MCVNTPSRCRPSWGHSHGGMDYPGQPVGHVTGRPNGQKVSPVPFAVFDTNKHAALLRAACARPRKAASLPYRPGHRAYEALQKKRLVSYHMMPERFNKRRQETRTSRHNPNSGVDKTKARTVMRQSLLCDVFLLKYCCVKSQYFLTAVSGVILC